MRDACSIYGPLLSVCMKTYLHNHRRLLANTCASYEFTVGSMEADG
jgi:hypothetical protein